MNNQPTTVYGLLILVFKVIRLVIYREYLIIQNIRLQNHNKRLRKRINQLFCQRSSDYGQKEPGKRRGSRASSEGSQEDAKDNET